MTVMRTLDAAVVGLALVVLASACGTTSTTAQSSPSPVTSASASASLAACTSSGPASPDWPDPSSGQPGHVVSATASGDTLTRTFAQGTPQFDVMPQSTAQFTTDPQCQSATLTGNAGVLIKLSGFQGVLSIAVGLSSPGCAPVTASGSTLVFVFAPRS